MATSIEEDLRNNIEGEVRFDSISRTVYSVDASIYEIEPLGIVLPKTTKDIITTASIASYYRIPLIARGAGTGIVGGCIGKGIIIDTSKYLHHILDVNYDKEYAICQPGVVQNKLNDYLNDNNYRLGPDTSTGNRATLGGMVASNSAGARSLRYGKMIDHVLELELVLPRGEVITFKDIDYELWKQKCALLNSEGRIYREMDRIRNEYHNDIERNFPKIPRRVSGYNLDELIKPFPFNPCKLIVGSEGSLGIVTRIKVDICKKPKVLGVVVLNFYSKIDAYNLIGQILPFCPSALEMIDDKIITAGRQSPSMREKLDWLKGTPSALFATEFDGETVDEVTHKIQQFTHFINQTKIKCLTTILMKPQEMEYVWGLRKSGLGLLLSKRSYSRAIAFVEDITIAPDRLGNFLETFEKYLSSVGKEAGIYGHVGSGCMHLRPYIDLRDSSELKLMKKIMLDISDIVLEYGGALSGEHGDGLVRSWLNEKMFGPRVYLAFKELKKAFDPDNNMNPGKVVSEQELTENLRLEPNRHIQKINTFLNFTPEGGFELAADLCNGNGQCRKKEGVMCPSFHASLDEFDTTRARAQGLRAIINSRRPLKDFTSEELHRVLDLCIECKGCKAECPSQVDMAKMKAEFLYHFNQAHGISFRATLFGHIGSINHWLSSISGAFNLLSRSSFSKFVLSKIGIAPQRNLPPLAKVRFSKWFSKFYQQKNILKQVVLFNDTYTEFNYPNIGISAVKILSLLGYSIILPPWKCCGRPLISKGLLPQAKKKAEELVKSLLPYAEQNIPIIGLEPSCILTIIDDFSSIIDKEKAQKVANCCRTIDQFLNEHIIQGELPLPFDLSKNNMEVKLHGHCYQKAITGTLATMNVLKAIPGFNATEIASGCCGMAGSFGYESEHYHFSLKIGETRLFPAIRSSSPETLFIANGLSCRSQIAHGTERNAIHLVQAITDRLNLS